MPTTGQDRKDTTPKANQQTALARSRSFFSLPAPLRQLFDAFPLSTYDENQLPQRISRKRNLNTIHVFTLSHDSSSVNLSINPACLKWQAFLLVKRIPFEVVSATNHASPTEALPFILPGVRPRDPEPQAIPSSKIQRWAATQGAEEEHLDIRLEAYMSLIDQNIRAAWLYALYLQEQNFKNVACKLYIEAASSNRAVQLALATQLQSAAKEQLLRTRTRIDEEEIYQQADTAFRSLQTLLDGKQYFSAAAEPGLFDIALFSYTHLILGFGDGSAQPQWSDNKLQQVLQQYDSLVAHRQRVLDVCLQA